MPKLIRFPQVDERPTPPAALQVDDGSESWWSGVQLNFAAIPIAATIAAVALSANLAWGYQQQTEDIVPQPVVMVAEDDSWHRPFSVAPPVYTSGPTWDDQVRASPQLEEDGWWVYTPPLRQPQFLYLPDPEEAPAGSLHGPFEEDWPVYVPSPAAPRFLFLPDDEQIVPQAVVTIQDEDLWQVYTPAPRQAHPLYLPDPEEIPAGSLFGVPEQDAWAPPLPVARRIAWLPVSHEEIVPQPTAFVPDDDAWQVYAPSYQTPRPLYLPDPEQIPAGSLFGISDDDAWLPFVTRSDRRILWVPGADDELVPQPPVVFVPDEDFWFIPRAMEIQHRFFTLLWGDGSSDDITMPSAPQQAIRSVVLDPSQPPRSDTRQPERGDPGQPSRSDPRQPRRGGPRQPPRS
jgi:hypothetical protein